MHAINSRVAEIEGDPATRVDANGDCQSGDASAAEDGIPDEFRARWQGVLAPNFGCAMQLSDYFYSRYSEEENSRETRECSLRGIVGISSAKMSASRHFLNVIRTVNGKYQESRMI